MREIEKLKTQQTCNNDISCFHPCSAPKKKPKKKKNLCRRLTELHVRTQTSDSAGSDIKWFITVSSLLNTLCLNACENSAGNHSVDSQHSQQTGYF